MNPINISTSTSVFRWKPAAWLRVNGADAANFLQGQFTQELRGLAAGEARYGLWLSVKGKVLADSFVCRGAEPDEFCIGSYFSPAAVIRDRLESHIIADDVTIEDVTDAWSGVSLLGESAPAPLVGFSFRGRRSREPVMEWVYPRSITAEFAGAREIDAVEMTRRRIEAGIPAVPVDIGPGDLPNEGGLEADAISFTKGCYLGQEVMARLKSMGQVRRRLLRVHGTGAGAPAPPAPLFLGARQVGELRSAIDDEAGGFLGLAMLSLLHLTPEAALAFAPDAAPVVRLIDAP